MKTIWGVVVMALGLTGCGGPELVSTWKFDVPATIEKPGMPAEVMILHFTVEVTQGAEVGGFEFKAGPCRFTGARGTGRAHPHQTCVLNQGDDVPFGQGAVATGGEVVALDEAVFQLGADDRLALKYTATVRSKNLDLVAWQNFDLKDGRRAH